MILLIDADVVCYRAAFAAQHQQYNIILNGETTYLASFRYKKELSAYLDSVGLEEGDYTISKEQVVEPVANALYSAKHIIQSMLDKFDTKQYKLYLTGKDNYRMKIASYYKANRTQPKPVHYVAMREYLINVWGAEVVDGQEADDALGIAQWNTLKDTFLLEGTPGNVMEGSVICTNDKDLDTIPGWHYDFTKQEDSYWIDQEYATWFFYKQLLMGDTVDNIKGIPGIGAKTAEKLLENAQTPTEYYNICKYQYEYHYTRKCRTERGKELGLLWADRMLVETAQLLYIRKEEGELWQPPE